MFYGELAVWRAALVGGGSDGGDVKIVRIF
jgi:hypothetical protein